MKIASVISYCSYHNPYIQRCYREAAKVSDRTIVIAHDKFYDGKVDNHLYENLRNIDYTVSFHTETLNEVIKPARYYHNELRKIGYEILKSESEKYKEEYDAVFFIDADEILEGDRVKEWLQTIDLDQNYKLAHFWYYRDTCYRADQVEEGAVLVSTKTLESPEMNWFGDREREDFTKNWNYKASYKNKVLGHHYSWAGTKEMILRKVSSWGHNNDNVDWKTMVENEYSHDFNYRCPFKPYTFTKIEPYIDFTFNE